MISSFSELRNRLIASCQFAPLRTYEQLAEMRKRRFQLSEKLDDESLGSVAPALSSRRIEAWIRKGISGLAFPFKLQIGDEHEPDSSQPDCHQYDYDRCHSNSAPHGE